MTTIYVLEITDIEADGDAIKALFDVCVVNKDAGAVSEQEMAVYFTGDETPLEWRDAIVSQLTAQIGIYFPAIAVSPSDFVIVNVTRGA